MTPTFCAGFAGAVATPGEGSSTTPFPFTWPAESDELSGNDGLSQGKGWVTAAWSCDGRREAASLAS